MDFFEQFKVPEQTRAGYCFADTPVKTSYSDANVAVFGVPLDTTTSFGKGTARGPDAIRLASAKQIETYVFDQGADIYDFVKLFDLGNLKMPRKNNAQRVLSFLESTLPAVVKNLRSNGKIPVMLGGEHTITYFQLKALANEKPLVIHFDAHRDMKPEYEGMKLCHTTPFYHLLKYIPGKDIVQIGIRQADKGENTIASKNNITTFDAWQVHNDIKSVESYLHKTTPGRNLYISFDIDAYDICYVPCTGTPEPYGLDPFQVSRLLRAIHPSARLSGLDMVEVGLKNDDYREGALATQTLLRILSQKFIRP